MLSLLLYHSILGIFFPQVCCSSVSCKKMINKIKVYPVAWKKHFIATVASNSVANTHLRSVNKHKMVTFHLEVKNGLKLEIFV